MINWPVCMTSMCLICRHGICKGPELAGRCSKDIHTHPMEIIGNSKGEGGLKSKIFKGNSMKLN